AAELVGQVPTRALELPGRPVAPAGRETALAHPAAEVDAGVHIDDLGAEEPVEPRALRRVGHVDLDLSGTFPQDARHGVAASFELVSHGGAPSCRLGWSSGGLRAPGSVRG